MSIRIRFIQRKKPVETGLDREFQWLCSSLGFCEPVDRDRTAIAILRKLIESSREGGGLRSDDISELVGKSRGATVNHLNKLIGAGLVIRRANRYELRERTLANTIRELHRDMERIFEDLERTAEEIDERVE